MTEKGLEDTFTVDSGKEPGDPKPLEPVMALSIVSHPVANRAGQRAWLSALAEGHSVKLSRNEPDFLHPTGGLAQSLDDPYLSRNNPVIFTAGPSGGVHVEASERSKVSVSGEPLRGSRLLSAQEVTQGVVLELAGRVVLLLHRAFPQARTSKETLGMVGHSMGLHRVRDSITRVADMDIPVLIRGETGSGKELIARALHQHSARKDKSFISVNMGALSKDLAAAELFGAVKGAYSGSVSDRRGFFREAQGGTLFLDEVGETPLEVQALLLRVLEAREFYPVGSTTAVRTEMRLVTATDANLEKLVQEGRFKEPLLHRLAGYEIRIPSLRERRDDIGPLFFHFARTELEAVKEGHRLNPSELKGEPLLPAALASRLVRYSWPGNIRQLKKVASRLVINRAPEGSLKLDPELDQELSEPLKSLPPPPEPRPGRQNFAAIPEEQILEILSAHGWEIKPAAEQLRVARATLQDWYQKNISSKLPPDEFNRAYEECEHDVERMVQRLRMSRFAIARRLREMGVERVAGDKPPKPRGDAPT